MYHYNAFISYNHNPRDIKITSMLQNQLENYKIPRGVKTSTGLTKIERVFLDKGELEVAGDLNKIICDALENTEWLIVICSPESRQSIWVQREIEYFLQFHSIDKILTVITEGEPFDVLPEILLQGDREPLSCDYRQPMRIAKNVELPRLVAALIGCKYDDLVQRQRHYRMRRMTIALSAVAVILLSAVTYLIWSNNQIRTNLEASLIEQSTTLSIQSEQALDSGDRIGALKYAIEALPSEEQNRPVVSKAILALSRAMNLYISSTEASEHAVRRYPLYGNRHILLKAMEYNGRNYIAELFSNGKCVLWNADTGEELMAEYTADLMEEGSAVQNLTFSNGNLILITKDSIRIVEPAKESEIKAIPIDGEYFKIYDYNQFKTACDPLVVGDDSLWIPAATVSDEEIPSDYSVQTNSVDIENNAANFGRDTDEIAQLVLYQRRLAIQDIRYKILRINLNTGKVEAETSAPDRPTKIRISPDGKHIACCYTDYNDSVRKEKKSDDRIVVMNANDLHTTGSIRSAFISDFGFDLHNRLLMCGFDRMPEKSDTSLFGQVNYTQNGSNHIYSFSEDRNLVLKCYDTTSCAELWSRTKSIHVSGAPWLSVTKDDDMLSDAIICTVGDYIMITDADGKELESLFAKSAVVLIDCFDTSLTAILENGEITAWKYDKNHKLKSYTQYHALLGPVKDYTESGDFMYVTSTDSEARSIKEILTQYDSGGIDSKWEAYEYDETAYSEKGTVQFTDADWYEDAFVEIRRQQTDRQLSGGVNEIIVRDINTGKVLMEHDVVTSAPREDNPDDNTLFKYSGIDRKRGKVYFLDNNEFIVQTLLSVDLKTGKEEKTVLTMNRPDGADEVTDQYPSIYDILSPADLYPAYYCAAGVFSMDGDHIYYPAFEASPDEEKGSYVTHLDILEVDPETGETAVHWISEAMDKIDVTMYVKVRINGACKRLVSSDASHFTVYDFNGRIIWTGEELSYDPAGFTCADDGTVIALENSGSEAVIHIYSSGDGSETAAVSLGSVHMLTHEKMDCINISDDEKLIIVGDDAHLVDSRTWELRTSISDNYIAYSPQIRQFMLGYPNERITGHAPYRTLQEMIAEAKESLQ